MILPELFVERMKKIQDYDEFIKSYEKPPVHGVRVNKRKDSEFRLFNSIVADAESVPWCKNGFYIDKDVISGNHPYHIAGMLYFQEPSAMCAAELFEFEKGDLVLDLCAAPGGKSTQIAENSDIVLVSNEIIQKRCSVLSENIERMGFENVIVTNESPDVLAEKYTGIFDKIIIDAPCSGEGMFKKEPAAIQCWSMEHVSSCAERQKKILDSAMKMLKTGGSIVYSTCTFSDEENEGSVNYILDKYPYMELVKSETLYPHMIKGEGHFAALLKDCRDKEFTDIKKSVHKTPSDMIKLFKDFENKYLNTDISGEYISFGDYLYMMPRNLPIDGIKIKRAGLMLGECRKGRFEPAHALSKYLKKDDFKNYADYRCDDNVIHKYLCGETINGDFQGYGAVLCDGLPLGFVKGVNGILKNHFPKGLRLFK